MRSMLLLLITVVAAVLGLTRIFTTSGSMFKSTDSVQQAGYGCPALSVRGQCRCILQGHVAAGITHNIHDATL